MNIPSFEATHRPVISQWTRKGGERIEDRAVKYVSKRRTGGGVRIDGKDMQSQMQTGSGMKRQETQEVVVGEKEEERD